MTPVIVVTFAVVGMIALVPLVLHWEKQDAAAAAKARANHEEGSRRGTEAEESSPTTAQSFMDNAVKVTQDGVSAVYKVGKMEVPARKGHGVGIIKRKVAKQGKASTPKAKGTKSQ